MTTFPSNSLTTLYTLIKDQLMTSPALASKFTSDKYLEYEPKHKSSGFNGFPYIIIKTNSIEQNNIVLTEDLKEGRQEAEIILRVEYMARANFKSYVEGIMNTLDQAGSAGTAFTDFGYYDGNCNLVGINDTQIVDEKEVVEARFTFTPIGYGSRS